MYADSLKATNKDNMNPDASIDCFSDNASQDIN